MIYCQFQKTYHSKKSSFQLNIKASFLLKAINVIFGPSGSGKTSLLRLISGLDIIDEGSIRIKNKYWTQTTTKTNLPLNKREIAYVFQENSLFPNMTVLQNLNFVKKEINSPLLNDLIATLEIKHLLMNKPNELSGGQKQRVSLARAILQEPNFLLLDEPLTALDEVLRKKLQSYLITLQKKYKFTVIMVSHNLQEVLKIADHVCVLNYGEILEQGPANILLSNNPKNTLKGTVLKVENNSITVLIATQQIKIEKSKILKNNIAIGDFVEISI